MTERWITNRELAELMGVSLSTIKRWTAGGMPSETWGMARTRRYLASACVNWARSRVDTVESTPRRITVAERKD
jgi:phage terminase Nu1 subunit (DNA packaging protein)